MSTRTYLGGCVLLTAALLAGWALAHPGHAKHGYGPTDASAKPHEPNAEQKKKRLERVTRLAERRQKTREQRAKRDRIKLQKRLTRHLGDAPVTADIKLELTTHARRVAQLRQIRYLAAADNDYASVVEVDKALALENSRHEGWWRKLMKQPTNQNGGQ